MTITAALQAMKVPGEIWIDPTADPPVGANGGTSLGRVIRVRARRLARTFLETAEGYGGGETDALDLGESWSLAFALRGWDESVLSLVYPRTATTGDGDVMVRGAAALNATSVEGSAMTRRKILFAPDDADRHPGVYFQEGVIDMLEPLELVLDRSEELITVFAFRALLTSTPERAVQIGKIRGISL